MSVSFLEGVILVIISGIVGYLVMRIDSLETRFDDFRDEVRSAISKIPKRRDDL